ncbi:MAG TPA: phytoene/squalene synthase family protein [Terriglobales bacterium]|jgi:phytoene synthase|nr:phytoene/squalene synthase family protein [Terriglobales bacterium]
MSTAVQPAPNPFAPTESQLAVAYSVCRGITRSAAKNFYYAFLVLPQPKRQALCAVYAFMRRCDDIADDPTLPLAERRQKLSDWVEALHRAQAGHATDDAVLLALTDAQRRYKIPGELLDQLAYGTAMDVQEESGPAAPGQQGLVVHYKTFDDLYLYCYRVASVVGLICIRVFGYRDSSAEPLAERVGLAFQLTNIIRDVKDDAAVGRVYLPEEDLARFGIAPGDLASASNSARFRELLAMEADRARGYYAAGDELIPLIDEDSQPALWVLVTIYRRLLEKIAIRQYDVFSGKVSLTVPQKLTILGKGLLKRLA